MKIVEKVSEMIRSAPDLDEEHYTLYVEQAELFNLLDGRLHAYFKA